MGEEGWGFLHSSILTDLSTFLSFLAAGIDMYLRELVITGGDIYGVINLLPRSSRFWICPTRKQAH